MTINRILRCVLGVLGLCMMGFPLQVSAVTIDLDAVKTGLYTSQMGPGLPQATPLESRSPTGRRHEASWLSM